jgi:RNA polymerase sigma-70 factor (ECF subfamily)
MLDTRALIQRYCRNRDQAAFRSFYDQEAPRLWQFLVARGATEDAAYDLLNEAFMRFVQQVCQDPVAPKALLYRIAVNLHIDAHRRARVRNHDLFDDDRPDPAPAATEQAAIRQLVEKLPESEQNLVLMRYWIGLTHREVAAICGLPEGTVRREVATILKKLRELCR